MVELVEAGELAPKTVNNARTCLSVALKRRRAAGSRRGTHASTVPALPVERAEIEYLTLRQIEPYFESCQPHYGALAEFLVGTGARVSEAVATRWPDVDLDQGVVRIYRQRSRTSDGTTVTKGKRFHSVQTGPQLASTLRAVQEARLAQAVDDGGWLFLCPAPRRGRYAGRNQPTPPHRKTVHDWHEAALLDAGIRNMPLHSLRHAAAPAVARRTNRIRTRGQRSRAPRSRSRRRLGGGSA
jgi:integrase